MILSMYVVYDHPHDFPDDYVVRRWDTSQRGFWPTGEHWTAKSLKEARAKLPGNLHRIPHQVGEDTKIVETWL